MSEQNNSENILEIKNIEVVYDDVILAVSDVSLDVPKGSICLLYTSPSPRDNRTSRMPSSA